MSNKKVTELNFGDRLKQARNFLGISQTDMATELDISPAHISKLEAGKSTASYHLCLSIEYLWGISIEWLDRGVGPMFLRQMMIIKPEELNPNRYDVTPPEIKIVMKNDLPESSEQLDFAAVPILEDSIAAGNPSEIRDHAAVGYAVIHRSQIRHGRHIACFVRGDSMAPLLGDGDIVAINLERTDPEILVGAIVAAVVDEDGVTIKRLIKGGRKGQYILLPENRSHDPFVVEGEGLRIVGQVVWAWRNLA